MLRDRPGTAGDADLVHRRRRRASPARPLPRSRGSRVGRPGELLGFLDDDPRPARQRPVDGVPVLGGRRRAGRRYPEARGGRLRRATRRLRRPGSAIVAPARACRATRYATVVAPDRRRARRLHGRRRLGAARRHGADRRRHASARTSRSMPHVVAHPRRRRSTTSPPSRRASGSAAACASDAAPTSAPDALVREDVRVGAGAAGRHGRGRAARRAARRGVGRQPGPPAAPAHRPVELRADGRRRSAMSRFRWSTSRAAARARSPTRSQAGLRARSSPTPPSSAAPRSPRSSSEYADFAGVAHCVGVANGTDALELALRAVGVGPGDEVILPANTFIATAEAVARIGAAPVLVDVRPGHLPDRPRRGAGRGRRRATRAIVPVHLFGQIAPVEQLAASPARGVADRRGRRPVARARPRHGRAAGARRASPRTSFYPGKNLGAVRRRRRGASPTTPTLADRGADARQPRRRRASTCTTWSA